MESIEQAYDDLNVLKSRLYQFADSYDTCHVYDSNQTATALDAGQYEMLMACGVKVLYKGTASEQIERANESPHWKFMYLGYGKIGKEISPIYVFEPEFVFYIRKNQKTLKILNNGVPKEKFQHMLRSFRAFSDPLPGQAPMQLEFGPVTEKNPRPYGMPPFGHVLSHREIADIITFIRQSWGNQASSVVELDVLRGR